MEKYSSKSFFVQALDYMHDIDIFIEIGPHPVLGTNIKNTLNTDVYVSSNRKENSSIRFMSTLVDLWSYGIDINLDHFGISNNEYIMKHEWDHKEYINQPPDV